MAKKKHKKRSPDKTLEALDDSLGELIDCYRVNVAVIALGCAVAALIGFGLVGYGLTREPISRGFVIAGGAVVLLAFVLLATSGFNIGRSLELRKQGIRYRELGHEVEIRWDDVVDVQVERIDRTNMGVVTKHTRSSDEVSPSGPLTNTEWQITIIGHDRQRICLRPTFLKLVPDVRKLISRLRLRAGF